jgi:HK97 family phage portal protein
MAVSAVYSSIGLISGAISSMPLHVYRRSDDGAQRTETNNLWFQLNEQPHPDWSAAMAKEYMLTSLLIHGDAFARIVRAPDKSMRSGEILGFEPLNPLRVQVVKIDGVLKYYSTPQWSPAYVLDAADILHVPGLGFNGLRGLSPLQYALRSAGGVAMAMQEYSAQFFENNARPDFMLTTDGNLSAEAVESLRTQWDDRYKGLGNAHKPAILQGGLKVAPLTLPLKDQELLASRKFQIDDIARIFGVPPFMIGSTENTSSWGTGVEQMSIGFVKYTLQRHLTKFEEEINRKFFRTASLFVEFNTAGLERGDIVTRYEAYRTSLGRAGEPAWATVNEVRKLENLPPIAGGDVLNTGIPAADPASPDKSTKPTKGK